jgi:ligand-binding sensor domain-containing protein
VYDTSNSALTSNTILSIATEGSIIKWIGSWGGLFKFDGTKWTVYNTSNSGLPDNYVKSITIDAWGNKWIGTLNGGVAVFKEGGVVSIKDKIHPTPDSQNKLSLTIINSSIKFRLPYSGITNLMIYNAKGKLLTSLVSTYKQAGTYQVNWDKGNYCAGVYYFRLKTKNHSITKRFVLIR